MTDHQKICMQNTTVLRILDHANKIQAIQFLIAANSQQVGAAKSRNRQARRNARAHYSTALNFKPQYILQNSWYLHQTWRNYSHLWVFWYGLLTTERYTWKSHNFSFLKSVHQIRLFCRRNIQWDIHGRNSKICQKSRERRRDERAMAIDTGGSDELPLDVACRCAHRKCPRRRRCALGDRETVA